MDNCPICLENCSSLVNICKNKHLSCKECIKKWRENSDTCPVCRSMIEINGKYNPREYKVQHRFNDYSIWENYNEIDNSRIISSINLNIKGGSFSFKVGENGPSFDIYWGNYVSNSILQGDNFLSILQGNNQIQSESSTQFYMYNKQKDELKRWNENYKKYGLNEGIIVQRNKDSSGMRLVRIIPIKTKNRSNSF